MIVPLSHQDLTTQVLAAETPVLLDFYADWCGPCQALAPVIDAIAEENPEAPIFKVNIDDEPELARQFRVMSIPTLVLFKDGKEADRLVGVRPKEDILRMFEG